MEPCAKLGADDAKICERIRKLRTDNEEKQETIAAALGVARSTYAKLENGTNKFSIDMIVRLADHFSVDCDFLLRGHISEHSDICQETGLSGKAVMNLKVYGPMQKILSRLIENVAFSGFLAWVGRYIENASKPNPAMEAWGSAELSAYRQALEQNGFVVTARSEAARNHYEYALEELKKALDEIVEQVRRDDNGQH